jgi:hypothetical protein
MPTWDNDYLERLTVEAEKEISREVSPIYARESMAITSGTATYTFPNYVRNMYQATWKGKPVDPIYHEEAVRLDPKYVTTPGEPKWYIRSPEDYNTIRLIPSPNETLTADPTDDVFDATVIEAKFIISFYREPDTSQSILTLPDYIARRLIKTYVLMRAFKKEGKGQNLEASDFYRQKYALQLDLYKQLRDRYWMGKKKLTSINEVLDSHSRSLPRLAPDFTIPPLIFNIPVGNFRDALSFDDDVELLLS